MEVEWRERGQLRPAGQREVFAQVLADVVDHQFTRRVYSSRLARLIAREGTRLLDWRRTAMTATVTAIPPNAAPR